MNFHLNQSCLRSPQKSCNNKLCATPIIYHPFTDAAVAFPSYVSQAYTSFLDVLFEAILVFQRQANYYSRLRCKPSWTNGAISSLISSRANMIYCFTSRNHILYDTHKKHVTHMKSALRKKNGLRNAFFASSNLGSAANKQYITMLT